MPEALPTLESFPTARTCLFGPPEELTARRETEPISRFRYPDGHLGWVVTGYSAGRQILADLRFSSRPENIHIPIPGPFASNRPAYPGFFVEMDPPDHTRLRRLLTAQFTVRRMNQLEPKIAEITGRHLDRMASMGPPCDLVSAFALPIPLLTICELLGVPYADRERFMEWQTTALDLDSGNKESEAAIGEIVQYIAALAVRKRAEPGDDLLSGLAANPEVTELELGNIGTLLLMAGHETTTGMLSLGVLALLAHPDQMAKLRDDPSLAEGAVEELMRYLSVPHIGPNRVALEDVEVDGILIHKGETVTLSLSSINRDPAQFPDPETLDITRSARGHLSLGHGIHQCLGNNLSRVEQRVAFTALLRRFPDIELAVPLEQVRMRDQRAFYGVDELPVTWSANPA
ncbi:cytochrome P450 [Actinomadura vinacea]|uniref:Cytochrome P450 n=1 Tax=Actinomadura vinacea TaxID=115336 RepID=A0ABN3IHB8_9ACTN